MAAYICTRLSINMNKDVIRFIPRRYRVKAKWAQTRPKFPSTTVALQTFDSTYSLHLNNLWSSARVAMLSEPKYGALMNNFSSTSQITTTALEAEGCVDFITSHQHTSTPLCGHSGEVDVSHPVLHPPRISPDIKCLVFPQGDISRFKPSRPDSCGLLDYYLLDAASVLPVLALDVQQGHTVLDLCAAPGGKTLALLQTHTVGYMWANDLSGSRTARLRKILQSYLPRDFLQETEIQITSFDGCKLGPTEEKRFDRVLVDVPCTTDRHSITVEENNIFNRSRTKERQQLPLLQTRLLMSGIQTARPGGDIVYSTCSLSQLQNECVVQQAMRLAEEMGITVQVQDLGWLTKCFSNTFYFAPQLSVGELVLPHLCANFGPIYMCKLRRMN